MKWILPLLVLLCFGCKQEAERPKIEIYLLKERIASYEGMPILNVAKFDTLRKAIIEDGLGNSRYDTIRNDFIFAGKFRVQPEELQDEPFILNKEIIGFDLKKDLILLDSTAAAKVYEIKPEFRYGTQFVITSDKKPIIHGYFWPRLSSSWCHTFYINYLSPFQAAVFPNTKFQMDNSFRFGYGPIQYTKMENKPPYPPELIEAFRSSGRLIE